MVKCGVWEIAVWEIVRKEKIILYLHNVIRNYCVSLQVVLLCFKLLIMKRLKVLVLLMMLVVCGFSQSESVFKSGLDEKHWVDSVFNTMSLEQKIGQTIMIRSFSDRDAAYFKEIESTVKKFHVGGVCFFKGKAVSQVEATNMYQRAAKIPLFIATDGEHGVGMRLTDVTGFPYMMTLGATRDAKLMKEMGVAVAKQCKRLGINVNFIPSVDVNNNKDNPVINHRSFGDDRELVAKMGVAYIEGLQGEGVLATAKHFPGHGDTGVDSHYSVPVINYDRKRLDSLELYPFNKAIDANVWGVMIAHLSVPALDNMKGNVASRSREIITDLLKEEMGFKGLVFTDGLEMKGYAGGKPTGEAEVESIMAGVDVLLLPLDTEKTFNAILAAVKSGKITEAEIDQKCRKILQYKYRTGAANIKAVSTHNLLSDLNSTDVKLLIKRIFESAITVVTNVDGMIPIEDVSGYKIASLSIGGKAGSDFLKMMRNYATIDSYILSSKPTAEELAAMATKLKNYNLVIADVQNSSIFASKKYGISDNVYPFLSKLADNKSVILNFFANPYSLTKFADLSVFKAVICSYQDRIETYEASAQIIFGALPAKGVIPVSIGLEKGDGIGVQTKEIEILRYVTPEEVGAKLLKISAIDEIVEDAIARKVFPGCQIFAAKDGKVFINKSYGTFGYDGRLVDGESMYDLASLTKVLATTAAIMKLYDEGKIKLSDKLSTYLPSVDLKDKANLTIGNILIHQAGLAADIQAVQNKVPYFDVRDSLCKMNESCDSVIVANYIYTNKNSKDLIMNLISDSKLTIPATYKYSDLGFIMLRYVVENITGQDFESYLEETFYKPLGLSTMVFNPISKGVSVDRIIPTVEENDFRKQHLCGYVHDPKAALLGGIAGHAGLFANAHDVGVFMQMMLQNGKYDGVKYFNPETVRKFTTSVKEKSTHRAYGFNKPFTKSTVDRNPVAPICSLQTFGHTGFTGTCAWADPKNDIVFVFLSNRTYPHYNGINALSKERIRECIQQLVYESVN